MSNQRAVEHICNGFLSVLSHVKAEYEGLTYVEVFGALESIKLAVHEESESSCDDDDDDDDDDEMETDSNVSSDGCNDDDADDDGDMNEYFLAMMEAITPERWKRICDRAAADAEAGDCHAREWITKHLIG